MRVCADSERGDSEGYASAGGPEESCRFDGQSRRERAIMSQRNEVMGRGERFKFSSEDGHLYDVVAVNIETKRIRLFGERETLPNAEAIINMAVMRRGVDEEFYAEVPTGKYAEGELWTGK